MVLDPVADEQLRREVEAQYAADDREELDRLKKAVEMCIAAGFLKQEKFDQALAFVRGRK